MSDLIKVRVLSREGARLTLRLRLLHALVHSVAVSAVGNYAEARARDAWEFLPYE